MLLILGSALLSFTYREMLGKLFTPTIFIAPVDWNDTNVLVYALFDVQAEICLTAMMAISNRNDFALAFCTVPDS